MKIEITLDDEDEQTFAKMIGDAIGERGLDLEENGIKKWNNVAIELCKIENSISKEVGFYPDNTSVPERVDVNVEHDY